MQSCLTVVYDLAVHPTKHGVVTSSRPNDRGTFYAPVLIQEGVPPSARVLCGEFHSLLCVYQVVS